MVLAEISPRHGSNPQITQITLICKKLAWLDRLKKWEPVRHKHELAQLNSAPVTPLNSADYLSGADPLWGIQPGRLIFAPGFPIVPKAQPWDPRVAGFPAIIASHPGHPVNPVCSP